MIEVTISIPVTARFDGFECARDCVHFCGWCNLVGVLAHANENPSLPYIRDRQPTWIRPRWCCETFGMGEDEQAERDIFTNLNKSTVDLTHNAIDNEALNIDTELETMDAKDAEALMRWIQE